MSKYKNINDYNSAFLVITVVYLFLIDLMFHDIGDQIFVNSRIMLFLIFITHIFIFWKNTKPLKKVTE